MESGRAIVITGPVGAGKSSTAAALRELLGQAGVVNVLFDMDYLRQSYPEPVNDPFAAELGYRVLADAWKHTRSCDYGDAGPMNLAIIADVVESRAQRKKYETALPGIKIQIVRLAVDVAELVRRLEQRESSQSVDWYRNRAAQLTEIMERNGIGDIVVTVNGESPEAVAVTIAEKLKLL